MYVKLQFMFPSPCTDRVILINPCGVAGWFTQLQVKAKDVSLLTETHAYVQDKIVATLWEGTKCTCMLHRQNVHTVDSPCELYMFL